MISAYLIFLPQIKTGDTIFSMVSPTLVLTITVFFPYIVIHDWYLSAEFL